MSFYFAAFQLPPLAILGLGIVMVILLITRCRLHPFFALLLTGIVVGLLSDSLPGEQTDGYHLSLMSVTAPDDLSDTGESLVIVALVGDALHIRIFDDEGQTVVDKTEAELVSGEDLTDLKMWLNEIPFPDESILPGKRRQEIVTKATWISGHTRSHWVKAVETPLKEMGAVAGSIAFVIALAAVIGICLTESGAADKIVLRFVAVLGEKRAGAAMLLSGFVLSVPVFFDTVFFLLIPLARALARRVGKNYVFFVLAMAGGGVITHSVVPPTPGPLLMAEEYGFSLGTAILGGTLMGLLPAFAALWMARRLDRRFPVVPTDDLEMQGEASFSEEGLPPFWLAILPVVLPVVLVTSVSIVDALGAGGESVAWYQALAFFGNKNIALLVGAMLSVALVIRKLGRDRIALEGFINSAMQMAGVIILITSAGGAFGAMIGHSGIKDTIQEFYAEGRGLILLAWGVAAVMKIAQGSGTVAMITTSAMMSGIVSDAELGFHPLYIYMATGFGSLFISWMNDSGFWVVGRMSGFSEKQTLKTWTVLLMVIALVGLLQTMVLSYLIPLA